MVEAGFRYAYANFVDPTQSDLRISKGLLLTAVICKVRILGLATYSYTAP